MPAGYTAYLSQIYAGNSGTTKGNCVLRLEARELGGAFQVKQVFDISTNYRYFRDFPYPITFKPKTDIKIECILSSANNVGIAAGFGLICR
mgnify:CR=1 FL=1